MPDKAEMPREMASRAMSAPYLARGEEYDLALRWRHQGDERALHCLAVSHMRLVMAIARRFRHYGLPMPDMIQEGHVGLLQAAARFEPEREVRFSTYATWWIRAAIQDYILRNWSIVRGGTSSAQKALFFNLRRLRAQLSRRGMDRIPGTLHEDVAAAIGVPVADVAMMDARLAAPDQSLNATLGDEETAGARVDFLVDPAPLPDQRTAEALDGMRRQVWLKEALAVLNERELGIVRARRLREDQVTLEVLGDRLGISKERVRQIETRALEKLRRELATRHPQLAAAGM